MPVPLSSFSDLALPLAQDGEQRRQDGVGQEWQQELETCDALPDAAIFPEDVCLGDAVMRLPGRARRHPAAVIGVEGGRFRDAFADEGKEAAVFSKLLCIVASPALDARKHLARMAAVEAMMQEDIRQEGDAAVER